MLMPFTLSIARRFPLGPLILLLLTAGSTEPAFSAASENVVGLPTSEQLEK